MRMAFVCMPYLASPTMSFRQQHCLSLQMPRPWHTGSIRRGAPTAAPSLQLRSPFRCTVFFSLLPAGMQ